MDERIRQEIIKRLDSLLEEFKTLNLRHEGHEASIVSFNTKARSAIQASCSSDSAYWKKMDEIVKENSREDREEAKGTRR